MSGDDQDPPSLDSRWAALAALTPARIGLGRAGASLPTRELLRFGLAHAQARDAVHIPFRAQEVAEALIALGPVVLQVESAASSRELYLRRPDLGRRLSPASRAVLAGQHPAVDLAIVVGDGLSSTAIHQNAARFLGVLLPALQRRGVTLAPVVVASQARVALGDEIGASLQARAVVMLIGERPGLSSPDSLGLYLTFGPRVGLTDAARNCISNVRPGGLSDARAASTLAWLLDEALRRGLSGVALKDESGRALVGAEAAAGVLTAP